MERAITNMMSFIKAIHPFKRMINSPGLDSAFEYVCAVLPTSVIHEYLPKDTADDWEVPPSWEVKKGFIKDLSGNLIASIDDSHLFVAAYSEPIDGIFTKKEIAKHIRCHPTIDTAFFMEHRNAYNYKLVDWGITLPKVIWDNLPDDSYHVCIEVEKDFSRSMKVAECFIQGKTDKIISLTAHIDELCNDNLSSCAVAVEAFKHLQKQKNLHYSYQLLLIPETIGTFFYVRNNMEKINRTISMLNLETVGRGKEWIIKSSLQPNSAPLQILKAAVATLNVPFREVDFFDGYGNEERIFEYPTIAIPSIALQRFPFDEYHSSEDTPDKIEPKFLKIALDIVLKFVNIYECNYIPLYTTILPPWLTKHDLYFDSKDQIDSFHKYNNILQFSINGKNDIVNLALMSGIPFDDVYSYLNKFIAMNFITKLPVINDN